MPIVQKAIAVLLIIAILSTFYFLDYKGVKSQGVMAFMKNVASDRKAAKMAKKGTKTAKVAGNKGSSISWSTGTEDDDEDFDMKQKSKKSNINDMKKGQTSSKVQKSKKKVNLLSSLISYIFPSNDEDLSSDYSKPEKKKARRGKR